MGKWVVVPCPECGHDDNIAIAHDIDGLIVECMECHREWVWEIDP